MIAILLCCGLRKVNPEVLKQFKTHQANPKTKALYDYYCYCDGSCPEICSTFGATTISNLNEITYGDVVITNYKNLDVKIASAAQAYWLTEEGAQEKRLCLLIALKHLLISHITLGLH